jgi:hypothetical protein
MTPRHRWQAIGLLFLLALLLLLPSATRAQSRTTSAVRGTVLRADSTPLPDASVSIVQQETGARRSVATNQQGRFLLPLLPPGGPYTLSVSLIGYATETREAFRLQVGETLTLDFTLVEEAVELEGIDIEVERTDVFDPTQVGPSTKLDEVVVEAVPILSRDLMDLAVLSPLVKKTDDGGFTVAGQNARYNAILVDGVGNKDVFGLTAGGAPGGQAGAKIIPMDAVAQYEILVSPFDVRLSGFTGGVMNAVTRTGTNDWRVRGFAVHRTEALMGDLTLPTGSVDASGVDRTLFGLSVGGPIVRDRGHFFVSGEFEERHQPPSGFNLFRDDPALVRISPVAIQEFQDLFETRYGLETGKAGPYPLGQELANVFGRVDWDFHNGHRITFRNVFARAVNDEPPNRSVFQPYELSSNAVFRTSVNNTASLQVFSELPGGGANELTLELQRTTDETAPAASWPQVGADLLSSVDGSGFMREIRLGSQFYAQENDLEQTTLRLTNSLSVVRGNSTYTYGVTGAYYDIRHRYLPGAEGDWFFGDMYDFELNAPLRYQRTVLAEGEDPAVAFNVVEWGVFAQREMNLSDELVMRFGIRLDAPHVLDEPGENPDVLGEFGRSTSRVPSGGILFSPRWGFNYQTRGERRTQFKGGIGLFAGQLPFVWLSNAFHNNGLRSVTQTCYGRWYMEPPEGNTVPAFDPGTPPTACLLGDFRNVKAVTLFDEDFKYPQVFRISLGVDREITDEVSASIGGLLNWSRNQVALSDLNLGVPTQDPGDLEPYGGWNRLIFGNPGGRAFVPNPKLAGYEQVLLVSNRGRDWAYALTGEIRGRLFEGVSFLAGYTFARSFDTMSLVYTDMLSNMGFNPISFDPDDPPLRPSNYDRPHKFVAVLYGTPFRRLPDTEVSLLYTGESGVPFSYVYEGDLNGDGYPGNGGAFDRFNDLVYVPLEATDIPSSVATWQVLSSAINTHACLSENRGEILKRNDCRGPWQNRLDLRVAHRLKMGGADLRFEADIINLLNLVNTEWGTVESIAPVATLLQPRGWRMQGLVSQWSGGVLPRRDAEGRLVASEPWSVLTPDSQWQAQFGVRVTFGEG